LHGYENLYLSPPFPQSSTPASPFIILVNGRGIYFRSETDQNSVLVSAPKLTYNVVSVQFQLRWWSISALLVCGRNCSADDPKVTESGHWTWASHGCLHWLQALQPCMKHSQWRSTVPRTVSDNTDEQREASITWRRATGLH